MKKEQIAKVISNLQDYSRWMYYTDDGVKMFNKESARTWNGLTFKVEINDEGNFVFDYFENGFKVRCDCAIITAPIKHKPSLENIENKVKIINEHDIPAEHHEAVINNLIAVQSLMQRVVAYSFIARMSPETIEIMAKAIESGWKD